MNKPTISVAILRHMANCLRLTGCEAEPILARYGLRREDLDDPAGAVTLEDFLSFMAVAAEKAQNPHFGLHTGRLAGPDSLGALGFLFLSAPSLRQAFASFIAYLATVQQAARNGLVEEDGVATFEYFITDQSLEHRRQDAEFSIAVMHNFCRTYVGPEFELVEVRFEHSPIGDYRIYRDFFRCDVYFDQDVNSFSFEDRFLAKRGGMLDPGLFPIIEEHFLHQVADRGLTGASSDAVIRLVEASPLDRAPTLAEAAKALDISVATLHRRLRQQGRSWRDLVQQRRMNAAARLLKHSRRDVAEIALAVGFSESASFVRSFRRHFGTTPKRYRDS